MKSPVFMSCKRSFLAIVACITVSSLAGCGAPVVADGHLLARADAVLRGGQPEVVKLMLSQDTVETGETLALQVASRNNGFVYLYQIGTDGRTLTLAFPNEFDVHNAVAGGTALALPKPGWRLRARGPAGVGYLMAVVTEEPQAISTVSKAAGDGRFQLTGRYAASMVPLTERPAR
jgi:Domain of unknown function (DUF4384)